MDESREHLRPRVSLLGKPVQAFQVNQRSDAKYRRFQTTVYNFLERPKNFKATSYQLIVFLMVFLCLLLSVFSSIEQYEDVSGRILYYLEIVMVVWFVVEFIVRVWSAGCRSRYQQMNGRLHFVRRPLCLLDIVVTSASVVILCVGSRSGEGFATSALRGLRFFQILRMLRVDRRGGSWKLLGSVIWAHRQELFTTLYIGFLGLVFFSFMMFIAEKERNPAKFGTYPDALWWGVITLCTVGYGDAVPITWAGKLIACCCAILGITFFALPAGIMGSGFALKVQQQQRQKHLIRRKAPAAVLIQCLWRCYAADEHSVSLATWKIHTRPVTATAALLTRSSSQKNRPNTSSFMSRLSIRRKEAPQNNNSTSGGCSIAGGSPAQSRKAVVHRTHSHSMTRAFEVTGSLHSDKRNHVSLSDIRESQPTNNNSTKKPTHRGSRDHDADFKAGDDSDENPEGVAQLTVVHKRVIRAIRKIKFFVARRVFKEALKPYDVKDVIEQYSAGHLDMLVRVKDLQLRLDLIVGHPASKKADSFDSKVSLASRIVRIERQVYGLESKLDELIELYKEDRNCRRTPHPLPPTPSPPSMHSPSVPVLSPPPSSPPSPCPVEENEEGRGNAGHRIATKQLSEPFARHHRPFSASLVLPSDGGSGGGRTPRALGYASSTGALGSTATEAEKSPAEANGRHAQTNRRGSLNPRRCAPCRDRGGGTGKADGFARYHVRCPDLTQRRLQETVALSNGSRLSFTSESLASEDGSDSIVIDCSFPVPESCVV